jgi:hypothetical protein
MFENIAFVDFENVPFINFDGIWKNTKLVLVIGKDQKQKPFEFTKK